MRSMPMPARASMQRAELTFKHNAAHGRHGWLRLTPAYSVRVVDDILSRHDPRESVLDPFSGTATTPLCAAERGHAAVSCDINPFLVWFGNLKLHHFSDHEPDEAEAASTRLAEFAADEANPGVPPPPLSNIERWWSSGDLGFLCRLLYGIRHLHDVSERARDLLLIAFCRSMMASSNAAFNHQSMSFKTMVREAADLPAGTDSLDRCRQFTMDAQLVAEGARHNPRKPGARVVHADARCLPGQLADSTDLLITSPPYPNRMSYIRELRPYMYWLGFLEDKREAGELDWQAVGGTWGIATSRVAAWERSTDVFSPDYVQPLLERIRVADARSGDVLSRYVGKYFEDIWLHIQTALRIVRPGGHLHYIVGNSKFYDVVVPTETIYRDMLLEAGVSAVEIVPLRKRNSKKELIEFDVVATR
jgi:SAM-dependent methyltransferase